MKNSYTILDIYDRCVLCARRCGVDRGAGKKGKCGAGPLPRVYSWGPHHGEEPPVSGVNGSGTIFFSNCSMSCVYCQNYVFSHSDKGAETSVSELAGIMLKLQGSGCHNVNLVSPTHYAVPVAEALIMAKKEGLKIPVVYNTGGYDSPEIISRMDGLVDIYLPDMRYSDDARAVKYSSAPGYTENNRHIIKKMHAQVGVLKTDEKGIAVKGMIIRCLVLPGGISGTVSSLEFIANEVSKDTFISLMSQYYPAHKAAEFHELAERLPDQEYAMCLDAMESLDLKNGWAQPEPSGMDTKLGGHNIKPERFERHG